MMQRAARGFSDAMGKAARSLLALALAVCMCVPSAAVLALAGEVRQAGAVEAGERVTIVHPGTYYRYSDGGYSGYGTARMYVASNQDPLICAQPDKKSLPSGTYTARTDIAYYLYSMDKTYDSEANAETAADMIRTLMYYCYPESEGYEKSLLSSLDYIDDDDSCADSKHTIVVTLHIALSALYGNSASSAAHSGSSDSSTSFTNFVYDTICGGVTKAFASNIGNFEEGSLFYKLFVEKNSDGKTLHEVCSAGNLGSGTWMIYKGENYQKVFSIGESTTTYSGKFRARKQAEHYSTTTTLKPHRYQSVWDGADYSFSTSEIYDDLLGITDQDGNEYSYVPASSDECLVSLPDGYVADELSYMVTEDDDGNTIVAAYVDSGDEDSDDMDFVCDSSGNILDFSVSDALDTDALYLYGNYDGKDYYTYSMKGATYALFTEKAAAQAAGSAALAAQNGDYKTWKKAINDSSGSYYYSGWKDYLVDYAVVNAKGWLIWESGSGENNIVLELDGESQKFYLVEVTGSTDGGYTLELNSEGTRSKVHDVTVYDTDKYNASVLLGDYGVKTDNVVYEIDDSLEDPEAYGRFLGRKGVTNIATDEKELWKGYWDSADSGDEYHSSIAGCEYSIYAYNEDEGSYEEKPYVTLVTDSDGWLVNEDTGSAWVILPVGKYKIVETESNEWFQLDDTETVFTVTSATTSYYAYSSDSDPYTIDGADDDDTFRDSPSYGRAYAVKTSTNHEITDGNDCYSMEGTTIEVYDNAELDGDAVATWTCDTYDPDTSEATFVDEAGNTKTELLATDYDSDGDGVLDSADYWAIETDAGHGYYCPEFDSDGAVQFTVTIATTTEVEIENNPQVDLVDLALKKHDYESCEGGDDHYGSSCALGGASLAGITFQFDYYDIDPVCDSSKCDETYDTDENGTISVTEATSSGKEPTRSWVFQTDEAGEIRLDSVNYDVEGDYYLDGDALYHDGSGHVVLPIGTYVVTELESDEWVSDSLTESGYLDCYDDDKYGSSYEGNNGPWVTWVFYDESATASAGSDAHIDTYVAVEDVYDKAARYDAAFEKQDGDGHTSETSVWKLTNTTTGEFTVLVTDEESGGDWSSWQFEHKNGGVSYADNSTGLSYQVYNSYGLLKANTNSNGWGYTDEDGNTVFYSANGSMEIDENGDLTVVDEDALDSETGCWFGLNQNGGIAEVDEDLRALPYGLYSLQQISIDPDSETNQMVTTTFMASGKVSYDIDSESYVWDSTLENAGLPATVAVNAETEGAYVQAGDTVTDTIYYSGGDAGSEVDIETQVWPLSYDDDGTAYVADDATALAIGDDGETTLVSAGVEMNNDTGWLSVSFALPEEIEAGTYVVYERVYWAESGELWVSHTDATDEDQQIVCVTGGTTATDAEDGDKSVDGGATVTIVDTVTYQGLIAGQSYTLTATVHLKAYDEDGNAYDAGELLDADGMPVTSTIEFTPEQSDGSVDIEVTFDATLVSTYEVVMFEEVTCGGVEVFTHADITDEGQTVDVPRISTYAGDEAGNKTYDATASTGTVIDTVVYGGLAEGQSYTLTATLMDASTSEAATVTGLLGVTSTYTATLEDLVAEEGGEGSWDIEIEIDPSALAGKTVVVYETLTTEQTDEEGNSSQVTVATHNDIDDEYQTVRVASISTTATDGSDGDNVLLPSMSAEVIDTVSYSGLTKGSEYVLYGKLVYKKSGEDVIVDDSEVVGSTSFTAKKSSGEVEVTFSFDASELGGYKLVVYEYLYVIGEDGEEELVTSHADKGDASQTVTVSKSGGDSTFVDSPTTTTTPSSSSWLAKTGATIVWIVILVLALVLLALLFGWRWREGRKQDGEQDGERGNVTECASDDAADGVPDGRGGKHGGR